MLLLIVIFVLIFLLQIFLDLNSRISKKTIPQKYSKPIMSMTDVAQMLELYSKIYRSINLKVNANIKKIAEAEEEYVMINKKYVYQSTLFINIHSIYILELSRKENNFLRKIKSYQIWLLLFQFIFFAISFIPNFNYQNILLITAITTQALGLLISFLGLTLKDKILNDSIEIGFDILNLTDSETKAALRMKDDIKIDVFEYPIQFFGSIIRFFLPF